MPDGSAAEGQSCGGEGRAHLDDLLEGLLVDVHHGDGLLHLAQQDVQVLVVRLPRGAGAQGLPPPVQGFLRGRRGPSKSQMRAFLHSGRMGLGRSRKNFYFCREKFKF